MSKKEKKEKKHKKERKKEKRKKLASSHEEGERSSSKRPRVDGRPIDNDDATPTKDEVNGETHGALPDSTQITTQYLEATEHKDRKKKRKDKKKKRKKEKRKRNDNAETEEDLFTDDGATSPINGETHDSEVKARPIVESSACAVPPAASSAATEKKAAGVTLLLFYQYIEPPWSNEMYKDALAHVEKLAHQDHITGRMRVAHEGLNCTLTGSKNDIFAFCRSLRRWKPEHFLGTEFKLTHDLPEAQRFGNLKIIPVQELVNYGLEGDKAPPIHRYQGTHLEPKDYHQALARSGSVVIDVRNHYEANIGRFDPPEGAAEYLDPLMRKSTEFPVWLDKEETKSKLKNKHVLMYCTGGIRCERASALLKYKMEHDPAVRDLNIQGVYQLQGGIDKYFKEFPEGGYWKGKNYTFDRRYAHAPVAHEEDGTEDQKPAAGGKPPVAHHPPMGKCEGCGKAWDKYRGKRRCPTCGVPSLTCKECFQADQNGTKKLGKNVRCDLCVEQGIFSKNDLRTQEHQELEAYEAKMTKLNLLHPESADPTGENDTGNDDGGEKQTAAPNNNPEGVTRLFLRNMCKNNMTEQVLMDFLPGITHIVWKTDHRTRAFGGQGWIEFETPEAAGRAMTKSGEKVLGRPLYMVYQPPNAKDSWPPPNSSVV